MQFLMLKPKVPINPKSGFVLFSQAMHKQSTVAVFALGESKGEG
jgi:hypothetical protein